MEATIFIIGSYVKIPRICKFSEFEYRISMARGSFNVKSLLFFLLGKLCSFLGMSMS